MKDRLRHFCARSTAALTIALVVSIEGGTTLGQTTKPKDCVEVETGVPTVVQEGRYNILCLRPKPGPFLARCRAEQVMAPSSLTMYPFDIEGPSAKDIAVKDTGLILEVDGVAGIEAHLFLSYGGPFDPIRDGYTLTCRW
jgi:hypothetical protein